MTERGSNKIVVIPVDDRRAETLIPLIEEWVEDGTFIMSDMWAAYGGIVAINAQNQHAWIWQQVNHRVQPPTLLF